MPRYAAIDIGSNSVRMLAAEVTASGGLRQLAEDRQVTRIGESVFANGEVSEETLNLVMSVLERMRKAVEPLEVAGMRAVATSAVRDARNQQEFLRRAEAALGIEVEIISGQEEARLIHHGVVAEREFTRGRQLLIDIGGGSAEFILNEDGALRGAYSKPLGAVRMWQSFLKTDPATPLELLQLEEYIEEKIGEAVSEFGSGDIDFAIGTSASASAAVCAARAIPRANRDTASGTRVSREELEDLYRRLAPMTLEERRKVTGIGPRRAEIIVPGVALLARALSRFGVDHLVYSSAGVRDGIVLDLDARGVGIARITLTEEQRGVVEGVASRFGVDLARARRTARFSLDLFVGLEQLHQLPPRFGRILEAAAFLRNVGYFISATKHHKHSHYIVSGVELPSFTENEQRLIAVLCRYHRKSMPVNSHVEFTSLADADRKAILLLIPLLRIADACGRSKEERISKLRCLVNGSTLTIELRHHRPLDLELWAIGRSLPIFRDVYRRSAVLSPVAVPEKTGDFAAP
ncbi:MAG: Ppx/GppA family phosphatase [Bryobacterales bacterium]|nr:Ppx/GppA family phosphatase [Bryobacterales bacterium]